MKNKEKWKAKNRTFTLIVELFRAWFEPFPLVNQIKMS